MPEIDRDNQDQDRLLSDARAAISLHQFGEAARTFARANEYGSLPSEDLVAWSDAVWWLGNTDRSLELAELGHQRLLNDGKDLRAATEAINLGFLLMLRGDMGAGSGWLQRARTLLDQLSDDPARGYLLQLDADEALASGALERAAELAQGAQAAARRATDIGLLALSLMTHGRAYIQAGAVAEGMALLDEAMLPVRTGQVPPAIAGNLYCEMIGICWDLADLRRAREWTTATERWCRDFDSSVMFSGICRMRRVQLRQVAGEWDVAANEARVVCEELVGMNAAVVAEGHYLLGDLLRLRGESAAAESAYLRAHELGRDPQPGLALLTLESGSVEEASTSLQTALEGYAGPEYTRVPVLRALVDVAIEAGRTATARAAASELRAIADRWRTDGLHAAAAHAEGAIGLVAGDPAEAIAPLREAIRRWQQLAAAYDCARARMLLARAYQALGDTTAANLELNAAEKALADFGAEADLRRLRRLRPERTSPGGLTPRESEILLLVAEGNTNRQIAQALVISEKTVARHLANLFLKLDVSTRTAAAAWARRHGLDDSA